MGEFAVRACVCVAAFLLVAGSFVTFIPGAQAGWYVLTAAFAVVGFLSRRRWVRGTAVGVVVIAGVLGWLGYRDGVRYREHILRDGSLTPEMKAKLVGW
jgi:hypothetical protein